MHTLLLNKYYVDEIYDAAIVEPIVIVSRGGALEGRRRDNHRRRRERRGLGRLAGAGLLRRLQTGSVRVYAASFLLGVVMVLGYYVWRFVQTTSF